MKIIKNFMLVMVLMFTSNIQASLVGEQISGTYFVSGVGGGGALFAVDSVNEEMSFPLNHSRGNPGSRVAADFSDNSLVLSVEDDSDTSFFHDVTWSFTLQNPDLMFSQVAEVFDDFSDGVAFGGITDAGKTISFTILDQAIFAPGHIATYDLTVVSSVPVPASFLLFGSGLMGIIGIKKRQAKV